MVGADAQVQIVNVNLYETVNGGHAAFLRDDEFNCRIEGVAMGVDEAGLIYEK